MNMLAWKRVGSLGLGLVLAGWTSKPTLACSTVMLKKGPSYVLCHNLNQPGMTVPGTIFVNKSAVFKVSRSWTAMLQKEPRPTPSMAWISRFGSVTFNTFGRDIADGGMNEAGLYIWEMNQSDDACRYLEGAGLPRLHDGNWIQFVLDSYSSVPEVLQSAASVALDGWGWHFFVADRSGDFAAVEYKDGRLIIHRGAEMPVPALFNAYYDRELEVARSFKGHGGTYEARMDDPRVPRFVKTESLLNAYDPATPAVEYGFQILERIKVNEPAKWSVVMDVRERKVHFRTSANPAIKSFALDALDFSNRTPTQMLDIDMAKGGDVAAAFMPFTPQQNRNDLDRLPAQISEVFTSGGLTREAFLDRLGRCPEGASSPERQAILGVWKGGKYEIALRAEGEGIRGTITAGWSEDERERMEVDHLQLLGNRLSFTARTRKGEILLFGGALDGTQMKAQISWTEGTAKEQVLQKQP